MRRTVGRCDNRGGLVGDGGDGTAVAARANGILLLLKDLGPQLLLVGIFLTILDVL